MAAHWSRFARAFIDWTPTPANPTQLAPPPFDPALFRFNEGACDAKGRFWVGVMFDPLEGSPSKEPGRLHSFTLDGGLRIEPDTAELHNGMAWSADGRIFFLSHSYTREIIAFDYDMDGGGLSNRRVFATIPQGLGIPDGAAIDSDGGYWSALHGGSKLRRSGSPTVRSIATSTCPVSSGRRSPRRWGRSCDALHNKRVR